MLGRFNFKFAIFVLLGFYFISFFLPSVELGIPGEEAGSNHVKPGLFVLFMPIYCLIIFEKFNVLTITTSFLSIGNIAMFLLLFSQLFSKRNNLLALLLVVQSLVLLFFTIWNNFLEEPFNLYIGYNIWMYSQIFLCIALLLQINSESKKRQRCF
jgi:hypothetical protein